jgi:hypothetical protein
MMRTGHTYNCVFCGKEQPKDWLYRPGHDDDPAMCKPCFDARAEIDWVNEEGTVGRIVDKNTGESGLIPVRLVRKQ